jgi:predicted nucleotidyltransferase
MDKHYIIQKLREVKPVLYKKYGVTELALFGSYSRNEQTEQSDIDIMFDYEGSIGSELFYIHDALQDLFAKEVQLVSKGGIKPKYFEAIKSDLIYA